MDIAMCRGETCPKAETCYRSPKSGTKPCEWRQSWFYNEPEKPCKYYWPVK